MVIVNENEQNVFDMVKVGKTIASLRKAKNMTQFELADKLCISFQAVSNWERGASMPDISKLPELAEIFDVTIDDILCRTNAVLRDVVSSKVQNVEEYSNEDISAAATVLKPSQMEDIIRNTSYNPRIMAMFLPFLSDKTIEALADESYKNGNIIAIFLPFLSDEKIEEFMQIAKQNNESIVYFIPFLKESTVANLAFEALEQGGMEKIIDFLPFMKEQDVLKLLKLSSQDDN